MAIQSSNDPALDNVESQVSVHSQTDQQAQLSRLAPSLMSALKANLPLVARDPDLTQVPVTGDTTGALGNSEQASGFAGEVLAVAITAAAGAPGDPPTPLTLVTVGPAGAGEAFVEYDADGNGIPTISFNAADSVDEVQVVINLLPADFKFQLQQPVGI